RVFTELARLIGIRRTNPVFGGAETEIVDPGNDHVFGYVRHGGGHRALAFANVTEQEQRVAANQLRLHGLAYGFIDLVTGEPVDGEADLILAPYRFVWLVADGARWAAG
ncbi:MAG: alpha-glucosidase C-terminal domain-containing protein, partial [Chloroflexota bacterium]|nr:alpha-glucosidase C-terminal domain-containing protein [Chloroflexota bacterium]